MFNVLEVMQDIHVIQQLDQTLMETYSVYYQNVLPFHDADSSKALFIKGISSSGLFHLLDLAENQLVPALPVLRHPPASSEGSYGQMVVKKKRPGADLCQPEGTHPAIFIAT
jgi:hypothetical protein